MKMNKLYFVIGFFISAFLFAEMAAHANETNQLTKISFSTPVASPGQVLAAGSYEFKVNSDHLNVVRILNADGTHLYATLRTVSAVRPDSAGDTVITLAKEPGAERVVLINWFYPGNTIGHHFVYSSKERERLAQYQLQTIDVTHTAEAGD